MPYSCCLDFAYCCVVFVYYDGNGTIDLSRQKRWLDKYLISTGMADEINANDGLKDFYRGPVDHLTGHLFGLFVLVYALYKGTAI